MKRSAILQGGFTLIELMIVVAIVGILAAVAVPNYQRYITKAKISESITLLASLKPWAVEYHLANQKYPATLASLGSDLEGQTKGSYLKSIAIENDAGNTNYFRMSGELTADVGGATGVSVYLETSDAGLSWTCGADSDDDDKKAKFGKYMPRTCGN